MTYTDTTYGDLVVTTEAILTGDRATVAKVIASIGAPGEPGYAEFEAVGECYRSGSDRHDQVIAERLAYGRALAKISAHVLRQAEGFVDHADWVRQDRARPERAVQRKAWEAKQTKLASVSAHQPATAAKAPVKKAATKKAKKPTAAQRSAIAKKAAATRAANAKKTLVAGAV